MSDSVFGDLDGLLRGLRYYLANPAEREAASANSLRVTASPDNDCSPAEFERRWWSIFSPGRPLVVPLQ